MSGPVIWKEPFDTFADLTARIYVKLKQFDLLNPRFILERFIYGVCTGYILNCKARGIEEGNFLVRYPSFFLSCDNVSEPCIDIFFRKLFIADEYIDLSTMLRLRPIVYDHFCLLYYLRVDFLFSFGIGADSINVSSG